ncbi:MAG: hypothetical protein J7L51_01160 [Desulfurococcales archaeon]|nr:hypothetical protein [Desulfurococcales archaeon]
MKVSKVILLFIAVSLVMSATLTSYAYSMWSETLRADILVKSGDVDVNFRLCRVIDLGCHHSCSSCTSGSGYSCSTCNSWCCSYPHQCRRCTVSDDGSSVSVGLSNIYPGWSGLVAVLLRNDGSIPAKVGERGVTVITGGTLGRYLKVRGTYVLGPFRGNLNDVWRGISGGCSRLPRLTSFPVIMQPGDFLIVIIRLHLSSNAPYGASGSLSLRVSSQPFNT